MDTILEGREAQIIRLRYGLDGQPPMPQREVADIIGISLSYVSRRRYCKRKNGHVPHKERKSGRAGQKMSDLVIDKVD